MSDHDFAVTVKRLDKYQFSVRFDGVDAPALLMDEPAPLGEGAGPNAARVLAAAVGNCLSASLTFCLQKARIPVLGMQTHVTGSVERNERGRLRITRLDVAIDPEVRAEDRARMQHCLELFEDFCLVTESVRSGIAVNVEVTQSIPAA